MDDTTSHSNDSRPASTRRQFLADLGATGIAGSALAVTAAGEQTATTGRGEPGVATSQAWPMFANDAANTGYNDARAPDTGISVRWNRAIDAVAQPTFDSTAAYVRGSDGSLYALDRETGETRWRYEMDGTDDDPTAAAVVDDVAYLDDGDAVAAVRTTSQRQLWRRELDGTVSTPATVTNDRVLVGTEAGTLYSLGNSSGGLRWTFETDERIAAPPAHGGSRVFFATAAGTVYARDARSGSSRWQFETDASMGDVAPVLSSNRVYVGDSDGSVYALDRTDGKVRWQTSLDGAVVGGLTLAGNSLFVGTEAGTLYALNTTGGYERWTTDTAAPVRKPVATDRAVYVATGEAVTAYRRASGSENWRAELPVDDPYLSVVDGLVAVVGGLYVALESGSQTEITRESFGAVTTRWTFDTGGVAVESPVLAGETLYTSDDSSACYAVSAADGTEQWQFEGEGRLTGPAADADTVYVGSDGGTVYAVDRASGEQRWSFDAGREIPAHPTHRRDTVFALDIDGRLYALATADGTERWRGRVDSGGTPPVVSGDTVYVGSSSGVVSAFDAESGEELWAFTGNNRGFATPAVADGTVYVGDTGGTLYAFDANNATEEWRADLGSGVRAAPTVAGESVYIGTVDGTLHALGLAGDTRWTGDVRDAIRAKPGVAGDLVTVGSDDEQLYGFDAETGEKRWMYDTAAPVRSTTVFGDDTVYVASADLVSLNPPNPVQRPTDTATPTPDTKTPTPDASTQTPTPDTTTQTPTPDTSAPGTPTRTPTDRPGTPTRTPGTPTSNTPTPTRRPPTGTPTPGQGSGTTVPPGTGGTDTPTASPTATATATPTDGGGGGSGDGGILSEDWVPYAGGGAIAAAITLGALVRRFTSEEDEQPQAEALDWGGGLDDDE